jgi:hypothetical protein
MLNGDYDKNIFIMTSKIKVRNLMESFLEILI